MAIRIADIFQAKIVDSSPTTYTVEITGDADKVEALINLLKPLGIKELIRTGRIAMDLNVRDRVLGQPRARELASRVLPDPSLDELRRLYGGAGVSDEEMVLRWLTSKEDVAAMRAAGPPRPYPSAMHPLVTLVEEITKRRDCSHIRVRRHGLSLSLEKRAATH